jgi:hypothetical protein
MTQRYRFAKHASPNRIQDWALAEYVMDVVDFPTLTVWVIRYLDHVLIAG